MDTHVSTAAASAIFIAAVAAATDWHSGIIPNWLTLPAIGSAPLIYGIAVGAEHAIQCLIAILLCSFGPYLLFRAGAMGGGDVKLFASLGAVTGFDPRIGIEIQLGAFVGAMIFALCAAAWRGVLLRTVGSALTACAKRLRPRGWGTSIGVELLTPIRMGGAILMATVARTLPYLGPHGSGP